MKLSGVAEKEQVKIFLTDISFDRKGSLHFERIKDSKYSCTDWIKFPSGQILDLNKNKVESLNFQIEIPYGARPGQYYSCVMVEPTSFTPIKNDIGKIKTVINMKSRIAIPVIIDVPGAITKLGGEVNFSEAKTGQDGVKIIATFKNIGNVLEEVRGTASIRNIATRKSYPIILKALNSSESDGMGKVFPDGERDFEALIDRPLPQGEYEATIYFDYGIKNRPVRAKEEFTVAKEISGDQSQKISLSLEPKILEIQAVRGGKIIKGVEISNSDFKPLKVKVKGEEWLKTEPNNFTIPAGGKKRIRVIAQISSGKNAPKSGKISFIPERGKEIALEIAVKEK